MKNSYIQSIYLLSFGCLTVLIFSALNYSGFCFSEFRYLSSEEKLESIFNDWNRSSGRSILLDGEYQVLKRKNKYASFAEFLKKHPNCCEVDPGGSYDTVTPFFIDRITGYDSGNVIRFKFNEEFIDPEGNILTEEISILGKIHNCGESYF